MHICFTHYHNESTKETLTTITGLCKDCLLNSLRKNLLCNPVVQGLRTRQSPQKLFSVYDVNDQLFTVILHKGMQHRRSWRKVLLPFNEKNLRQRKCSRNPRRDERGSRDHFRIPGNIPKDSPQSRQSL